MLPELQRAPDLPAAGPLNIEPKLNSAGAGAGSRSGPPQRSRGIRLGVSQRLPPIDRTPPQDWSTTGRYRGPSCVLQGAFECHVQVSHARPKTRSGELLRRAIQTVCEQRDPGELTTIEDPTDLQQIKELVDPL